MLCDFLRDNEDEGTAIVMSLIHDSMSFTERQLGASF